MSADGRDEPPPKRRKLSTPRLSLPQVQLYGTMASQTGRNPTTLELTETETKLRQLLLDVAAYIDETAGPGQVESAAKVPEELTKEKIVLRFTGGWVRDKLLGVGSHDIDVAINKMTGEHFGLKMIEYLEIPGNAAKHGLEPREPAKQKATMKEVPDGKESSKKSRRVAPGLTKIEANPEKSKNLETATTNIMGIDLDLVNLRKETYNEVSRNPEMEFGTPEEDAMRRDATVNAMFYNLNTSQIEDFTGRGFQDMQAKIIRTPLEPQQTFKDDPLRVLRLIRFASRLNYTIDPATEKAMSNEEIGEVLKIKISRERVGIELEKMLKGPDPLMAIALIDRLGLYDTIFTDPTRELTTAPDLSYFAPAYQFVSTVLSADTQDIAPVIPQTLARDAEEKYLAWICAALMPWADAPQVPHEKPTQRPYYAAFLVAREGFKAPNRISDVIAAALRNGEEIQQLVDRCYNQLKRPNSTKTGEDATSRDILGMAIRRWGASWRTQVLFNLTHEIVLGHVSRERLLDAYTTFLNQLTTYAILDAHTFKPLVTGTELAKAINTKPGPWMRDALDVVMAWQLRNPDATDPAHAIAAVRHKAAGTDSELPDTLVDYFLRLTVRPLFSQTTLDSANPLFGTGRGKKKGKDEDTVPWKDRKNSWGIEVLRWCIGSLTAKGMEKHWGLLVPPVLKMLDDADVEWKATGAEFLTQLLESTPPALLARTGLGKVFEDIILPLFTHLPTLTPEEESVLLLQKAVPAVLALADAIHPPPAAAPQADTLKESSLSTPREKFLDLILRDAIFGPLFHAPPPSYPRLGTTLLTQLPLILTPMGINSVKHIQPLTQLLSGVLAEPLGLAYPPLMLAAVKGLQSVMLNAWPRVWVHRGEVLKGCCLAWVRCLEEDGAQGKEDVQEVKKEVGEAVEMLDAVVASIEGGEEHVQNVWEKEKAELVAADERLSGLFEKE